MADDESIEDEIIKPFDISDAEAVAKAQKTAARIRRKKLRVVEAIMANEDGRAWMFDVLGTECHIFAENTMRDTPERNGRFEGERGVGLRLLDQIMTASPEMFWKMRAEAIKRAKKQ